MRVMINSPAVGVVYRQEVQAITPGRTLVMENSTRYVLHLALKPCRNIDEVNQERIASISPFGSIRIELSRQELPATLSFYLDPNYITTLTAPVQFIAIYDAPAIVTVTPGVPFDPANFGEPVQHMVIFWTPRTYA
ncbi:MAG: hypothetical protein RML46_12905 [Anaerolineae bacterium]|nr:hypothetical protein [Anaerolineae bacterium]